MFSSASSCQVLDFFWIMTSLLWFRCVLARLGKTMYTIFEGVGMALSNMCISSRMTEGLFLIDFFFKKKIATLQNKKNCKLAERN